LPGDRHTGVAERMACALRTVGAAGGRAEQAVAGCQHTLHRRQHAQDAAMHMRSTTAGAWTSTSLAAKRAGSSLLQAARVQ